MFGGAAAATAAAAARLAAGTGLSAHIVQLRHSAAGFLAVVQRYDGPTHDYLTVHGNRAALARELDGVG
jgi:hypothetical protein